MKTLLTLICLIVLGCTSTASTPSAPSAAPTTESLALSFPSGITCPSGTKPTGGWPLVFTFNGNCFKAVGTGSLAADVNNALVNGRIACATTIAYSNIVHASDIDAMIRTKVVPLINNNTSYINRQKIGSSGFSAGGTLASYLGTEWGKGIDPSNGTNYNFHVNAVLNFYGPLRMDRSPSMKTVDGGTTDVGGGGLFYLHENRSKDVNVDIPNIRQWNNPNCYCASRGTNQCQCDVASTTYLNAYLTAYQPNPTCTFYSDEPNLEAMSVTDYIQNVHPSHAAPMYLCSGWKDSNVDYDMNVHQASSWWFPQNLIMVRADDGHGFPLSVCNTAATGQGVTLPIPWMTTQLQITTDSPPISR